MKIKLKNRTKNQQQIIRAGKLEPLNVKPFGEIEVDLSQIYRHEVKRIKKFFEEVKGKVKTKEELTPKTRSSKTSDKTRYSATARPEMKHKDFKGGKE